MIYTIMGMFDSLTIELELPGLPPEFLEQHCVISSEIVWQTKDLDNAMSLYKIDKNGLLQTKRHEGNWVEGKPLEDPENASFSEKMEALGHFVQTKTWLEPVIGFTGAINFYDSWKHKNYNSELCLNFNYGWVEYKATFILGVMTSLELVSVTEPVEYTPEEIAENVAVAKINRESFILECQKSRKDRPSTEQKLIDSIMDVVHSPEPTLDEDTLVNKLNAIEDLIITYRNDYDKFYTAN